MTDPGARPSSAWLSSPVLVPAVTGIIGLVGGALAASLQSRANIALERERLRSQLILQAIQTGNPHQAALNLAFLVRVGLVVDSTGNLASYVSNPDSAPVLPSSAPSSPASVPGSLLSGSAMSVHVHLTAPAQISWYRKQTPNLINTLPGVYGPGDTAFVIPYGGTIFVRAADSAKGRFSEKSVDCTRSVTCSVAFP